MTRNTADTADPPTASVIIAAYTMDRWEDLCDAVASVLQQTTPVTETVVVIDHNPALLDRARAAFDAVTVIPNAGGRGASGARNTGVAASSGEVVAFLDDDAVASPTWLEALLCHFDSPHVVGVGGRLDPLWAGPRPQWFPPEFGWAVGASYLGMPERATPVRNVWSGNMVIRRKAFEAVGGFRADFGKVGRRSRPEDTDLCLRASDAQNQGVWIYEPAGLVRHRVPRERASVRFFLRRCFHEGLGKAALSAFNGAGKSTSEERHYTRHVVPAGVIRNVRAAARGDAAGPLRGIAIMAGFSLVATGYAVGLATQAFRDTGARRAGPRPGQPSTPVLSEGDPSGSHPC